MSSKKKMPLPRKASTTGMEILTGSAFIFFADASAAGTAVEPVIDVAAQPESVRTAAQARPTAMVDR